jgi:predicted dehydrogenase
VKAVYSRSTKSAQLLKDEAIKTYPNVVLYSDDSGPETTLDKLLSRKDVTAVVVVLPILVQPSIIRKCLAAGKHVLAEKPIAADLATARSLIEDYNKDYKPKGLVFSIAEQFRYAQHFIPNERHSKLTAADSWKHASSGENGSSMTKPSVNSHNCT